MTLTDTVRPGGDTPGGAGRCEAPRAGAHRPAALRVEPLEAAFREGAVNGRRADRRRIDLDVADFQPAGLLAAIFPDSAFKLLEARADLSLALKPEGADRIRARLTAQVPSLRLAYRQREADLSIEAITAELEAAPGRLTASIPTPRDPPAARRRFPSTSSSDDSAHPAHRDRPQGAGGRRGKRARDRPRLPGGRCGGPGASSTWCAAAESRRSP
ncbi:MAG: hypothetical protein MZV70_60700 [Desulfobacterales bacterium]|nr:hypothetical protein [Desulfobacterales bacterium]